MTTPPDDERTVLRGVSPPLASRPAAFDGESADALPPSTRLHEFEILSVIGQGGFGIVYLAHDTVLDRRVAIKEYMPSTLATRTQAMTVAVRSSRHTETFSAGLRSFINEARLLAQFDHPSLLKVLRFWEAHGTAYMAMPYYAGITFSQLLKQLDGPPSEAQIEALLHPLLDALALMHEAHCYHRDIAPDNILILPDGRPMLLDFGAARRVIGDMTQALTVILKTGFAPVEQYGEMPGLSQGPWTDLYALGSVLHFAITGHTPPQAVARFLADKRVPLALTAAGRYSQRLLAAIDRSLAVLPKDRPQSVAQLRELLEARPRPRIAPLAEARAAPAPPRERTRPPPPLPVPLDDSTVAVTRPATIAIAPAVAPAASAAAPRDRRRRLAIGAALGVALSAIAGSMAWWGGRPAAPADVAAAVPAKVTAAPVPAASAPPASDSPPMSPTQSPTESRIELPTRPVAESPTPTHDLRDPEPTRVETEPAAASATALPSSRPAPAAAQRPPRVAAATAPAASLPPQHIPNKRLSNERCADMIQRASLGEELSATDKDFLKQECGP